MAGGVLRIEGICIPWTNAEMGQANDSPLEVISHEIYLDGAAKEGRFGVEEFITARSLSGGKEC